MMEESITTIQSIELMAAGVFFVLGLSYLIHGEVWADWFKGFARRPKVSAIIAGMGHLIGGMFILAFHWVWKGPQVIVTIVGMIMTLEGVIYLLYPRWIGMILRIYDSRILLIVRTSGLVLAVLSVLVFYDLLMQPGLWEHLSQPSIWGHWRRPFGG